MDWGTTLCSRGGAAVLRCGAASASSSSSSSSRSRSSRSSRSATRTGQDRTGPPSCTTHAATSPYNATGCNVSQKCPVVERGARVTSDMRGSQHPFRPPPMCIWASATTMNCRSKGLFQQHVCTVAGLSGRQSRVRERLQCFFAN